MYDPLVTSLRHLSGAATDAHEAEAKARRFRAAAFKATPKHAQQQHARLWSASAVGLADGLPSDGKFKPLQDTLDALEEHGKHATPDHFTAAAKAASALAGQLAGVDGQEETVHALRSVARAAIKGAKGPPAE